MHQLLLLSRELFNQDLLANQTALCTGHVSMVNWGLGPANSELVDVCFLVCCHRLFGVETSVCSYDVPVSATAIGVVSHVLTGGSSLAPFVLTLLLERSKQRLEIWIVVAGSKTSIIGGNVCISAPAVDTILRTKGHDCVRVPGHKAPLRPAEVIVIVSATRPRNRLMFHFYY